MKSTLSFLLIVFVSVTISCKDRDPGIYFIDQTGLDLYWHHTFGLDKGRYILFGFSSAETQSDEFELKFDYTIKGREILIKLRETVSKGKCPEFPGSWGKECTSNGTVFIPENALSQGQYKFILEIEGRKVTSTLTIDPEKYTIQIPQNDLLSSRISAVYPVPKNLLFGSIGFVGGTDENLARTLISELEKLGLTPVTVPDYPYRDLDAVHSKHLEKEFREPNNYSISILMNLNATDAKTVFEKVAAYYEATDKKLRIGLYCSNNMEQINGGPGDQLTEFYKK